MFVCHPRDIPEDMSESVYYKLHKAFYGLRQAPLQWYVKLCEVMKELGFEQLSSDRAVFKKFSSQNHSELSVIVLVYVDDLIFLARRKEYIDATTKELLRRFEDSEDTAVEWYTGVHISCTSESNFIAQKSYIQQCLEEYEIAAVREYHSPNSASFYADLESCDDCDVIPNEKYRSMIRALMHLVNRTRSEIGTALSILAQHVE